MKHWLMVVALLGGTLAGVARSAPVPTKTATAGDKAVDAKVEFDMHNGYFLSNKAGIKDPETYLVVTTPDQFTKLFGKGVVMGKKYNYLPAGAFDSKLVVTTVKKGNQIWTYKVDQVTATAGVLTVQYEAKAGAAGTATFASPMILSVPKGDYKSVVFVENGKEVKKVDVGK
jgi:hypothetical protein